VGVVGEGDDDLGPRSEKLEMKLAHRVGEVEHDLWNEGAALHVAAPLELEQVPLGGENDVAVEASEKSVHGRKTKGVRRGRVGE
jgi:hypothetical protein